MQVRGSVESNNDNEMLKRVQHDGLCHSEGALATEESHNLEFPSAQDYDVALYRRLRTLRNLFSS